MGTSGVSSPTDAHARSEQRIDWRTIVIASIGGGLEFYDFIVYGVFAPYVARAFFPTGSPATSMAAAFAAFAVGYFARPVGGLVLGHIGDRFGRRAAFNVSLITMAAATIIMACIPTYASFGVAATSLFVLMRFVQGACVGGELPGAIAYVVETAPNRTGLACGLMFSCVNTGSLLAVGISMGLHTILNAEDIGTFGWRLAFLAGGVLGVVGACMRGNLRETPMFLSVQAQKRARLPAWEVTRTYSSQIAVGVGIVGLNQMLIAMLNVAMVPYLEQVAGFSARAASGLVMTAVAVMSIAIVVVGYAADRIRPHSLYILGSAAIAMGAYPFYASLLTAPARPPYLTFFSMALVCSLISGSFGVLASSLFPVRLRFSGLAISYNVAAALLGGFTPLATTLIANATGNKAAPGLLVAIVAIGGLTSAFAMQWISRNNGRASSVSSELTL